jgi:shikimate 5-dehydrogenase
VINATSASLGDEAPPLPSGLYAPGSLAYDMVYGRGLTAYLKQAGDQGAARWRTVWACWWSRRPRRSLAVARRAA